MKDLKSEKGVSLIALIIFLVMIILAAGIIVVMVISTNKNKNTEENKTENTTVNTASDNLVTPGVPDPEQRVTGAFTNMQFSNDGYTVDLTVENPGHPEHGSMFTTDFTIKRDDGSTTYYILSYKGVQVVENFDASKYKQVVINGKTFMYETDKTNSVTLIYTETINGKTVEVDIELKGNDAFDKEGNYAEGEVLIDEEVLKSEELARSVNFTISESK